MTSQNRQPRDLFEDQLAARLLREKLVSFADLEEAVRQQVIMGGHLATNLWELDFLDGATLSRLSAQILKVPEPDTRDFGRIPGEVLRLLPAQFVREARVLPLAVVRRMLRVATSEPWEHAILGEAAKLAGFPVQSRFVAEVPLMRLLSHHYHLPLQARFRLLRDGSARTLGYSGEEEHSQWSDWLAPLPTRHREEAHPPQINAPTERDNEVLAPAPQELVPIDSLTEARKALDAASSRQEVGEGLLRFALSRGRRVALMTLRGERWIGWLGAGNGVQPRRVQQLALPSSSDTIFGLVSRTGAHFMGQLKPHSDHQSFLEALGGGSPGAVAFLPVHFGGRLVFGIYLDAGETGDVSTDVAELLVLAQQVPSVLERLVKRRLQEP